MMDGAENFPPLDVHELGGDFLKLIGLLSGLRQLLEIRPQPESEGMLLQRALTALMENIPLERCSVYLFESSVLRGVAGTSFDESMVQQLGVMRVKQYQAGDVPVFKPGEGVMGHAFETGVVQYSSNCSVDSRYKVFEGTGLGAVQEGSLLALPLHGEEGVLGVLNVSHSETEFFAPWQRSALSIYVDAMAHLLLNYRLLRGLDHMVSERTAALEAALSESRRIHTRLELLSMTDELTGLHNRRYFFSEARGMVARALRHKLPLALVLLDMDFFKRINDSWGHTIGDEVLVNVAKALRQEIREGDLLARLGGEEFVILLPRTGRSGAVQLVERIRDSLDTIPVVPGGSEESVTACFGISMLDDVNRDNPTEALDELYNRSDKAMYQCKQKGRDCWAIYEDD